MALLKGEKKVSCPYVLCKWKIKEEEWRLPNDAVRQVYPNECQIAPGRAQVLPHKPAQDTLANSAIRQVFLGTPIIFPSEVKISVSK